MLSMEYTLISLSCVCLVHFVTLDDVLCIAVYETTCEQIKFNISREEKARGMSSLITSWFRIGSRL